MAATDSKESDRKASAVFRALVSHLRSTTGESLGQINKCFGVANSIQTLYQYAANPAAKSFRVPTVQVIEDLVWLAAGIDYDTARSRKMVFHVVGDHPSAPAATTAPITPECTKHELIALDLVDSRFDRLTIFKKSGETKKWSFVPWTPRFPDVDALLRHRWRRAYFQQKVEKRHAARIAGVTEHELPIVGREFPFAIQPTLHQVEELEYFSFPIHKVLDRTGWMKRDAA